jgi:hypothetical protein
MAFFYVECLYGVFSKPRRSLANYPLKSKFERDLLGFNYSRRVIFPKNLISIKINDE